MDPVLQALASLLCIRNAVDGEIARLIGRAAGVGHLGEFIAAAILDIELYPSATHKAADGVFRTGALQGKTVNIKMYGKQEAMLDITPGALPDFFLVLTGPKSKAMSSKEFTRPFIIEHVYLFRAIDLIASSTSRGCKIGVATSVTQAEWNSAEIWPSAANPMLRLDPNQIKALELFRARTEP